MAENTQTMERKFVCLPGVDVKNAYECVTRPGERWNGFEVPHFPANEAVRVVEMLAGEDMGGFTFSAFRLQGDGERWRVSPLEAGDPLMSGDRIILAENPLDDVATGFPDWPEGVSTDPEQAIPAIVERLNSGSDPFAERFLRQVTIEPTEINGESHYAIGGYEFTWEETDPPQAQPAQERKTRRRVKGPGE